MTTKSYLVKGHLGYVASNGRDEFYWTDAPEEAARFTKQEADAMAGYLEDGIRIHEHELDEVLS